MCENSYLQRRESCPICENHKLETIYHQKFAYIEGVTPADSYDVCVCSNCGLTFANNLPSQKEIDDYYKTNHKYESAQIYPWDTAHQPMVDYILKTQSKIARIADIGCGPGYELLQLADNGFENLYAIEPSALNCSRLEQKGINVFDKSLFEIMSDDFSKKMDFVLTSAVLEHIIDLHGFIKKILSFLSYDGQLLIAVPGEQLDSKKAEVAPFENFSSEHINYFSFYSLVNLMKTHSLEPVELISNTKALAVSFKRQIHQSVLYVEKSRLALSYSLDKLLHVLSRKTDVYWWGVGSLTRSILEKEKTVHEFKIKTFIDSDLTYKGKSLFSISIMAPNDLIFDANIPIVVCSYFSGKSIERYIKDELGLSNEVVLLL